MILPRHGEDLQIVSGNFTGREPQSPRVGRPQSPMGPLGPAGPNGALWGPVSPFAAAAAAALRGCESSRALWRRLLFGTGRKCSEVHASAHDCATLLASPQELWAWVRWYMQGTTSSQSGCYRGRFAHRCTTRCRLPSPVVAARACERCAGRCGSLEEAGCAWSVLFMGFRLRRMGEC